MFLLCLLLISFLAVAIIAEKASVPVKSAELIPVPVRIDEVKKLKR